MAALIRCCSSFSHTTGGRPPPPDKSRGPEIGKLVVRKPWDHHPFSKIIHSSSQPDEREGRGILQAPCSSAETLDKFSAFEGIGRLKLPVMVVLLTNSLQMATPFEALAAEICEPQLHVQHANFVACSSYWSHCWRFGCSTEERGVTEVERTTTTDQRCS